MPKIRIDVCVDGVSYCSAVEEQDKSVGEIAELIYEQSPSIDRFKLLGEHGKVYLFGPEAIRRAVVTVQEVI